MNVKHAWDIENEVSLTCLASIQDKLANACKWIKFKAIEICLAIIQTLFSTFMLRKVTLNALYAYNQIQLDLLNKVLSIYG